ncbi:hypothetical protein CMUS01_02011 [Colletotrichum musicola]|uniref:Major facilitator superfamily (MFS) profile domain-containing protein n=1 Tax=Colletotrichum musicola TaxID=2175873 RepID=A0A8H6U865_9PEZI|nr:hypothetical protein CMUS01_02011 [Colletotrichum musicola]
MTEEIFFVLICSMGQLLFTIHLGHSFVAQNLFADALQLGNGEAPWVTGAFLVANGVSVVISGSLADLIDPKRLVLGAFVWLGIWNLVGAFAVVPSRYPVFFVARAMSGIAVGILCSAAISMLGRVYRPGVRKNRVFALMGAMVPIGFSIGALQGGALSRHLEWVSGSTALLPSFVSPQQLGAYRTSRILPFHFGTLILLGLRRALSAVD